MAWDSKYNKDHNKRRRTRYAEDPTYRDEQKQRAADQRAKKYDETGRLMKELNGAMVPVYKMGEIAEHCDVTVFRVRSAFARGRLPQHSFEGKHVYVTQPQLELIKKAFEQSEVSDEDMRASLDEEWDNGC